MPNSTSQQNSQQAKEDIAYSDKLRRELEKYGKKQLLDQRDSGNKSVNKYGMKLPLDHRTSQSSSSLGSVDPELNELERTITDTRKSIDAKFYKSLVQSSVVRKNQERANSGISQEDGHKQEQGHPENAPRRPSLHQRPSPPSFATLNLAVDKEGNKRGALEGKKASYTPRGDKNDAGTGLRDSKPRTASRKDKFGLPNGYPVDERSKAVEGSQTDSCNSLNRLRSPPPYEEAVSSLERRRERKTETPKAPKTNKGIVYRTDEKPLRTSSGTDSNRDEKPRYLSNTSERRRYRATVKSANLEDLISHKRMTSEPYGGGSRNSSPDYKIDKIEKTRLFATMSESNISRTAERDARDRNIVQTRFRDVNDVINEKNSSHIRTGSADQLSGFASLLTRSRKSSMDTPRPEGSLDNTPTVSPREFTAIVMPEAEPYAKHERKLSPGRVPELTSREEKLDDKLPYMETSLDAIPTTVEMYSHEDENLHDTFTKIDRAFGFTSYAPPGAIVAQTNNKEERKRKSKKHRQRSKATKVCSDTSDDDSGSSSLTSSSVRRRNASGKPRDEDSLKGRPLSTDSLKKNKSEAEESLEAAITDFHSTLSNLPDQNSSLERVSSSDTLSGAHTPTPSHRGFSAVKTSFSNITPTARPQYSTLSVSQRRDYPQSSRATVTYSDKGRYSMVSSSRQSSLDSPSHSGKEGGSRVQELVGKFSETPGRKGSLDSSSPPRGKPDRFRSHSEARISLLASPSPWVKREARSFVKVTEANRDARRIEKHRVTTHGERNLFQRQGSEATRNISVTVTPKLDMDTRVDTLGPLPVIPNSPSWVEACERGMLSLPGRGKKSSKTLLKDGELYLIMSPLESCLFGLCLLLSSSEA